jgi:hypothetical protein
MLLVDLYNNLKRIRVPRVNVWGCRGSNPPPADLPGLYLFSTTWIYHLLYKHFLQLSIITISIKYA